MLPEGFLTFLFTDIEGSILLWERFPEEMGAALARHDEILRTAIESNKGHVFKTVGDAFCAVFESSEDAAKAALAAQAEILAQDWSPLNDLRVRIAIHSGEAELRQEDYYGPVLNRIARLLATAHGRQIVLSQAAVDNLKVPLNLTDLGSHRLKDLQQPEHVWQLSHPGLPETFPPLRSLRTFANNLPIQVSSFVGRVRELAEVRELLKNATLLTLVGAGGTGKTRLALQLAAEVLEDFPDGVWLVELAAVSNPDRVPKVLSNVLGVREEPGRSLVESISEYLRPKRTLIVLDNCEHLLEASARLAESLVLACPNLKVLTTTREALGVVGEQVYQVPTLGVPDEDDSEAGIEGYESVRLFNERARSHQPGFALNASRASAVAQVCRQLDGLPLAIELAAARIRVLPVERIAERLDDRFQLLSGGSRTALPRQQTLRALIDWSYDLLTPRDQTVLGRLSIFAGGWSLEAAEAVCSDDVLSTTEIFEALASLVDKSLVIFESEDDEGRYRLLQTVRQYAQETLDPQEFERISFRHRDFFLSLAEESRKWTNSPSAAIWLDRLEREYENLLEAMAYCHADPFGGEKELRFNGALQRFWNVRGYIREGRECCLRALTHPGAQAHTIARADALNGAGNLADNQGDYPDAISLYEESLAIRRELNDENGIAGLLCNLGIVADRVGDYPRARILLEESRAGFKKLGNKIGEVIALTNMANVPLHLGNPEEARALFQECAELCRQQANSAILLHPTFGLGEVAIRQGKLDEAQKYLQESLALCIEVGNHALTAAALQHFAEIAFLRGNYPRAAKLLGGADDLRQKIGVAPTPFHREQMQKFATQLIHAMGNAEYQNAHAEGKRQPQEEILAYALET